MIGNLAPDWVLQEAAKIIRDEPDRQQVYRRIRPLLVELHTAQVPKSLSVLMSRITLRRERVLGLMERMLGYQVGTFRSDVIHWLCQDDSKLRIVDLKQVRFNEWELVSNEEMEAVFKDIWNVALELADATHETAPNLLNAKHIKKALELTETRHSLGLKWSSGRDRDERYSLEKQILKLERENQSLKKKLELEKDRRKLSVNSNRSEKAAELRQAKIDLSHLTEFLTEPSINQAIQDALSASVPEAIAATAAQIMTYDPGAALRYIQVYKDFRKSILQKNELHSPACA